VGFTAGTGVCALAVADANRDGRLDVVSVLAGTDQVALQLGNGAGGLGAAATTAAGGSGAVGVSLADADADGRLDAAVALETSSEVSVLAGSGS
jgi:hypothetical protein